MRLSTKTGSFFAFCVAVASGLPAYGTPVPPAQPTQPPAQPTQPTQPTQPAVTQNSVNAETSTNGTTNTSGSTIFQNRQVNVNNGSTVRFGESCEAATTVANGSVGYGSSSYDYSNGGNSGSSVLGFDIALTVPFNGSQLGLCTKFGQAKLDHQLVLTTAAKTALVGNATRECVYYLQLGYTPEQLHPALRQFCPKGTPIVRKAPPLVTSPVVPVTPVEVEPSEPSTTKPTPKPTPKPALF